MLWGSGQPCQAPPASVLPTALGSRVVRETLDTAISPDSSWGIRRRLPLLLIPRIYLGLLSFLLVFAQARPSSEIQLASLALSVLLLSDQLLLLNLSRERKYHFRCIYFKHLELDCNFCNCSLFLGPVIPSLP